MVNLNHQEQRLSTFIILKAVSASSDGSCIVWDIKSFTRIICLFESTLFKQVVYHPDESQLLTTGSNKKITYWATFDGQAIRMLDGAEEGDINTLAITRFPYFIPETENISCPEAATS